MKLFITPLLFAILIVSCSNTTPPNTMTTPKNQKLETAYFASGCFWCAELIFENLKGVTNVVSGYAGGHTQKPTYESSNTGTTGHAEAIAVTYNPNIISFSTLVDVYFGSQDPTQVNGQGNDKGSQYRSILFYQNNAEKEILITKKEALSKKLNATVAAEIQEFDKFWEAEAYHQDYAKLHPEHPYVKGVSEPRYANFKKTCPLLFKEK